VIGPKAFPVLAARAMPSLLVLVFLVVAHGVGSLGHGRDDCLPQAPEVRSRIFAGSAGPSWEGRQHRLVLLAKE